MKTVTFPQKMSGTGTIHDTASQHFDRTIEFPSGQNYAVVLAAYYGNGNLYSTHATASAAAKKSRAQKEYSHVIIDSNGNYYETDGDSLTRI